MKKLIVFMMAFLFVFSVFGEKYQFSEEAEKVIEYMEIQGIVYEIDYDSAVKELPEGEKELTIDGINDFFADVSEMNVSNELRSVLLEHYAFAGIEPPYQMPSGRRLVLAGGVDSTAHDGYRYKWERYSPTPFPLWFTVTKERHCPGGSGDDTVSFCEETDPSVTLQIGDYSEYTACGACDNNVQVTFRYCVNLYTEGWARIWDPFSGTYYWVLVKTYAGWQCAIADGTSQPYNPTNDLCVTPVLLTQLCPYID